MRKFFLISFFTFSLFIIGSISTLFIYPERSQKFIIESLNFKTFLNKKVKNLISKKIKDGNINVDIEKINFLKPEWPNIAKIELDNVNIYSMNQQRKSKNTKHKNITKKTLGLNPHQEPNETHHNIWIGVFVVSRCCVCVLRTGRL